MGKRRFLPDERCLGGAMELNATYNDYLRRTYASRPQSSAAPAQLPTAEELSLHRAQKLAESDSTQLNHRVNIQHLCRRMADAYSITERRKDPYDVRINRPPTQRTLRPNPAVLSLCPWLPQAAKGNSNNRRPATAPAALSDSSSVCSSLSGSPGQLRDWQQFKQKPVISPPVEAPPLPPSRYYPGPNLLPSVQHRLYKASIMADILDRHLYKAREIRSLCEDYVASSPVEHKELIRNVAAEVLEELDVYPTS